MSFTGKKYFCVFRNIEQLGRLMFYSKGCVSLEALLMSKGLKEASFLGATFLLGLATLEALLHFAGF